VQPAEKAQAQTGTFGFWGHGMPTLKNKKNRFFFTTLGLNSEYKKLNYRRKRTIE
jgi:hypothetical protein